MSTAGDIIDRVIRQYLELADDQPTVTTITAGINASVTAVPIDVTVLAVEEVSLLGITTMVEVGTELMRVTGYDTSTSTLTVRRGAQATTAATHASGAEMRINPRFPRRAIFDAIGDVIAGRLYPQLYYTTVRLEDLERVTLLPATARALISCRTDDGTDVPVQFRRSVQGEGPGLIVSPGHVGVEAWVEYRSSFARPTTEATDLTTLGLDPTWDEILVVGAAASLLQGREFDRATLEYLSESVEAQGIQLGQITNVATALLRYQQYLLSQASLALRSDTVIGVSMNEVL